jgi:hypothetical protein
MNEFSQLTKLPLCNGVLRETVPDHNRIVLWLPEVQYNGMACRERVASVAGAKVSVEQQICAVAATSIRARRLGIRTATTGSTH